MSPTAKQIVQCYEELHLDLQAIVEQFPDFDIAEIKTVLISYSTLYRHDIKMSEGSNLDFKDDELAEVTRGIIELARNTEDENLKFRVLRYIRNDKKGRLDVMKNLTGLRINVLEFNERFQKALRAEERTYNGTAPKQTLIEVGEA